MNRDWREFAGSSPTAWMADELFPFIQDGTADESPDSRT
jgi:hypothetical protein